MEAEGSSGAAGGESGLSGWPANHFEIGYWVIPAEGGQWMVMTDFRYGMIYSQEPLGGPVTEGLLAVRADVRRHLPRAVHRVRYLSRRHHVEVGGHVPPGQSPFWQMTTRRR